MIHVVDMAMGGGKTSAAITYMNEHPDQRFLYITPFLDETVRVVMACSGRRFVEPSDRIPEYRHRKREHLRALINQGRNISLTHALFLMIDDITARAITDSGYTIIIDEVIDVFEKINESEQDINMLLEAGYIQKYGGDDECEYFRPSEKSHGYDGVFNKFFERAQYGQIVRTSGWEDGRKIKYGFWQVNRQLFTLSDEIFILTYMFDGMPMKGFLDSNGLKYDYIGTRKCEDGAYRFSQRGEMPSYLGHVSSMVHVCNKNSINAIGSDRSALSSSWTKRSLADGNIALLARHIHTYFRRHIPDGITSGQQLWSVFNGKNDEVVAEIRSKKPGGQFLEFNSKAVNCYGDRAALAYCVNIFADPNMVQYLRHVGVEFNEDRYAVAQMVQWIWRSRIRNGQEIWVYIPSRRMRELFIQWMETAEEDYKKEARAAAEAACAGEAGDALEIKKHDEVV